MYKISSDRQKENHYTRNWEFVLVQIEKHCYKNIIY